MNKQRPCGGAWLLGVLFLGALVGASRAAAGTAPSPVEAAGRFIRSEFERIGRRAPSRDPALDQAAQTLAERVLARGAKSVGDLLSISRAVSSAQGHDPNPRAILLQGPRDEALKTFFARKDLGRDPATHVGIGSAQGPAALALVVLFSERRARLDPFPREVAPGHRQSLCGRLEAELAHPEVYVTRPRGSVERVGLSRTEGDHFCVLLAFTDRGSYHVEVLGRGSRGPEVAALFHVEAGSPKQAAAVERSPEPRTVEQARPELRDRINALRKAHGAGPLRLDDRLSDVAQAYSERMAREGFFAHVDPAGKDLKSRLAEARIPYQTAGENLGLADGPIAAHFGIELSPGHRKNLLDPAFTHLGVGVAPRQVEGRADVLVTEVLARASTAVPTAREQDPAQAAYRAIAELRSQLRLPAVVRHQTLEKLAQAQAQRLVLADDPDAPAVGEALHDRVFKQVQEARSVAVDVFIADSVAQVPSSENLKDAKNTLVGVGVVRSASRRYGPGKHWVVVIYSSTR